MDILVPLVLHGGQHVGVSWYGTSGSYDGYLITATLQVDKLHNIKRFTNTREPLSPTLSEPSHGGNLYYASSSYYVASMELVLGQTMLFFKLVGTTS